MRTGYHIGVLNPSLHYVAHDLRFSEDAWGGALAVSALLVGATIGALFAGQLADKVGPKRALQLNNLPMIVGVAISAGAWELYGMCLGAHSANTGHKHVK